MIKILLSNNLHLFQVVNHIESMWDEFRLFVQAEWSLTSVERYVAFMSSDGTFASELECIVATKINHLNLSIYRKIGLDTRIKRILHSHHGRNVRTAYLLFSGQNEYGHYDVLILQT